MSGFTARKIMYMDNHFEIKKNFTEKTTKTAERRIIQMKKEKYRGTIEQKVM